VSETPRTSELLKEISDERENIFDAYALVEDMCFDLERGLIASRAECAEWAKEMARLIADRDRIILTNVELRERLDRAINSATLVSGCERS